MLTIKAILLVLSCILALSTTTEWSKAGLTPSSTPREDIVVCYMNETLAAPYRRMPMTMENLIGIIRKLEQHHTMQSWDARRMAGTLLWRFRYDGLHWDPAQPHTTATDDDEWEKMSLIANLISGETDIPEGILTTEEKCALHWMLSYAIDRVLREDEDGYSHQYSSLQLDPSGQHIDMSYKEHLVQKRGVNTGYRNRVRKLVKRMDPKLESTKPRELGAVYTKWGTVTAGTVLSGIAGALDKQSVAVRHALDLEEPEQPHGRITNGQMHISSWAATLAGDIGQSAVQTYLKQKMPLVGPAGEWDNLVCPHEYVLLQHDSTLKKRWSYLTDSEINGGIDGLLLASMIKEWNKNNIRLSQLLDMYYSEMGIVFDLTYRACNRYEKFKSDEKITGSLVEEATAFAKVYAQKMHQPILKEEDFDSHVQNVKNEMEREISGMNPTPCKWREENAEALLQETYTDLYIVLDTSVSEYDWNKQKNLTAALASAMDIFGNGSHIAVVNGKTGEPIIPLHATQNGAEIGFILQGQKQLFQETEPDFVINMLRSNAMARLEYERKKTVSGSNAQVVMFVLFKKINTDDKEDFEEQVYRLRRDTPDVRLMFATTASRAEFHKYVEESSKDKDIISLSNLRSAKMTAAAQMATEAKQIAQTIDSRFREIPARLFYPRCYTLDGTTWDESRWEHNGFVSAGSVQYFSYGPEQFFSSEHLKIKLKVTDGELKVCESRDEPNPSEDKQYSTCKEVPPSSNEKEAEFTYSNPCGEDGELSGCKPIYFSIEGIDSGRAGYCQDYKDLPCKYPTSVRFTVTHDGMTCNGAMHLLQSPSLLLLTAVAICCHFFRN